MCDRMQCTHWHTIYKRCLWLIYTCLVCPFANLFEKGMDFFDILCPLGVSGLYKKWMGSFGYEERGGISVVNFIWQSGEVKFIVHVLTIHHIYTQIWAAESGTSPTPSSSDSTCTVLSKCHPMGDKLTILTDKLGFTWQSGRKGFSTWHHHVSGAVLQGLQRLAVILCLILTSARSTCISSSSSDITEGGFQ